MNAHRRSLFVLSLLAAGALALAAAPASAAHISFDIGDDDVHFDGDEVLIHADDSEARIEPNGRLTVDGRRVALGERDRQALVLYNRGLRNIKDEAIEIGFQGANLAVHAVAEAIVAVTTGNHRRAERHVEAKAEDIKDAARELCQEMRTVQALQDSVAKRVRAFRPFAVIDVDRDDCRVDD